eukprot:SAG31_NODE_34874_length_328_cov_0.899563_1_plen_60_part_10
MTKFSTVGRSGVGRILKYLEVRTQLLSIILIKTAGAKFKFSKLVIAISGYVPVRTSSISP